MRSPSGPLAAVLALLLLAAGCLSGGPAGTTTSPTPTATPTAAQGSGTTATTPADGHEAATNRPDPDKSIRLENGWNRSITIRIRIVRDATGETVHDDTYDLPPDSERTAYDLSEADPDGIESFTVVVTARNRTEHVGIETNACYGDVYVEIQDDGTLYPYYAIC